MLCVQEHLGPASFTGIKKTVIQASNTSFSWHLRTGIYEEREEELKKEKSKQSEGIKDTIYEWRKAKNPKESQAKKPLYLEQEH